MTSEPLDVEEVVPVPGEWVLVHEPSGAAFDSIIQLAVFHWGWATACNADEDAA